MDLSVLPGQTIVVWFSCGAASTVAAKLTLERFGATNPIRIVNNPVAEEDPDNRRFLADVERWLGVEVELATHPRFPDASAEQVWDKERFMAGPQGAPCTRHLKKGARQHWERSNHADWHVLGFTADRNEVKRYERFVLTERPNVIPILADAAMTKGGCFSYLARAGISLPAAYLRGYPNANCIGCVKATSPSYWNHVRQQDPDVFARRAEQSRTLGVRLVRYQGKRIFLDELPANAVGRPIRGMDFECGIFCEERPLEKAA